MDDCTFDQKTALEWINIIEDERSRIRESDIYPKLRAWVNQSSPVDILDIGCGQGICSDQMDLDGRNYTGLEPSSFLLDSAKQKYGYVNRHFLLGNAYSLPFSDDSFDAAFSIAVWHLLDDIGTAARELSRVLRVNGHFLIITAHPDTYSVWKATYTNIKSNSRRFEGIRQLSDGSESGDVLFLHTYEEIMASLQTTHLRVQEIEAFRNFILIKGRNRYE